MTSTLPPADSPAYLESLMRAGQDALKQFDDALASAAGVRGKEANPAGQSLSPLKLIADVQRAYFTQLWRFWNTTFLQAMAGGTQSNPALPRGDKRFKDDAWHDQPYYELLSVCPGTC